MASDNEDTGMEVSPASLAVIAQPLATKKLQKKLLKMVKKGKRQECNMFQVLSFFL